MNQRIREGLALLAGAVALGVLAVVLNGSEVGEICALGALLAALVGLYRVGAGLLSRAGSNSNAGSSS